MSDRKLVVIVAAFGNESGAAASLEDLKLMQRGGTIDLVDVAVVVHDVKGAVRFEESVDPGGKTWAKRGAVAGGIVGLLFPPALLASAAVGGASGGLWGKIRDKGFKDEELKAVGAELSPGSSAILAVADEGEVTRVVAGLTGYQSLTRHPLSADASAAVLAAETPANA